MVCDVIGYHEEATSKQHRNFDVSGFSSAWNNGQCKFHTCSILSYLWISTKDIDSAILDAAILF